MLSNNMLRNINSSYSKMSKLQDQINSGKVISRPSDDPVVAVKGMQYRTELGKVEQFTRNLNEVHGWLETTDTALDQAGNAVNRIRELVVQAANDSNTTDDRAKIKVEIDQIRQQLQDIGNSKVAGKGIFTGTNTQQNLFTEVTYIDPEALQQHFDSLYDDTLTPPTQNQDAFLADYENQVAALNLPTVTSRVMNSEYTDVKGNNRNPLKELTTIQLNGQDVSLNGGNVDVGVKYGNEQIRFEVFDGVTLNVNTPGADLFGQLDELVGKVSAALDPEKNPNHKDIQALLGGMVNTTQDGKKDTLSEIHASLLSVRADVGARQNRVETIENRLSMYEINVTKQMSENEDTDYAKAITDMTTYESIHQAALSVGAKIIQQTLVDFMR